MKKKNNKFRKILGCAFGLFLFLITPFSVALGAEDEENQENECSDPPATCEVDEHLDIQISLDNATTLAEFEKVEHEASKVLADIQKKSNCLIKAKDNEPNITKKSKFDEKISDCDYQYRATEEILSKAISKIYTFQKVNLAGKGIGRDHNVKLKLDNQSQFQNSWQLFTSIINLLIRFVGVASFIILVIAGFRLILATGNDNEIQRSKAMITYAIVGLAIALLAYIITAIVRGLIYT